ncbi:hypothetical protein YC2023_094281 [Brassica napus]
MKTLKWREFEAKPKPKQKRRDRFRGTGQWYGLDRWEETRLRWEMTSSVVGKTKIEKVEESVQGWYLSKRQDSIMGDECVMTEKK